VTGARTVLVVNARARRGEHLFDRAREELVRADVVLRAAEEVKDPAAVPDRVRAALADGADTVVVGGGDGTLAAAAGVLAGSTAALGVLPLGTANDFARTLGLPSDLRAAARAVASGARREVDVGRIGDRVFLNAASVGVSSGLTRRLDAGLKDRAGMLAYPAAGAAEAASVRPFRAELEVDGARRELDLLQLVVGNGRFHGGGRLVAPGARLDDRHLDLYFLESASGAPEPDGPDRLREVARLARYALLLVRGRHLEHPAVHHERVKRVVLRTEPSLEVDADGELVGETPATFEVWPRQLTVLAPTR
jgi:diacylglycerol kinase (ATP)